MGLESRIGTNRKAIAINPNDPMVYSARAEFRFIQMQFDEAIEDAKKAHKLDPLSIDIVATVTRICVTTGHFEEAEKYCREAEILDSNHILVNNMRGYITGFNGDWNKALEILKMYIKLPVISRSCCSPLLLLTQNLMIKMPCKII